MCGFLEGLFRQLRKIYDIKFNWIWWKTMRLNSILLLVSESFVIMKSCSPSTVSSTTQILLVAKNTNRMTWNSESGRSYELIRWDSKVVFVQYSLWVDADVHTFRHIGHRENSCFLFGKFLDSWKPIFLRLKH